MANLDLLEPEHLYNYELKYKHHDNVVEYFTNLVKKAGTNKEANKATCTKYYEENDKLAQMRKELKKWNILKILFIFLCIVIAGIFLLIFVWKPHFKDISFRIAQQEELVNGYLEEANVQMASLNALFETDIPAKIMQTTTPLIEMDRIFDVKKYELLHEKYGLWDNSDEKSSTLDLQSGSILGNPFVIFKDRIQNTVTQRYEGSLMISYYRGFGKDRHMVHETLHAYVEKPKPVYSEETYLVYGNEAANHLSFSRSPSCINSLDEKGIEKYVRKHERDLEKMAEKAQKKGGTYTPLGNSEFELFFGGLDRDNEVEFRLLFTPLAQKSMMQVLKSKVGYGDDFKFIKDKGLNLITSAHSQGDTLFVSGDVFKGFDLEKVYENFVKINENYFRALFFDFAPLLSIPLYQQHKSHEYIYKDNVKSNVCPFEHEVLANKYNPAIFLPIGAKTMVILKTFLQKRNGNQDTVKVVSHSFDTIKHTELVYKMGGDGRMHGVPVDWIEYVPVAAENQISAGDLGTDNEIKFRNLGRNDVIYERGLVSTQSETLNVDINQLKAYMAKD